MPLFARFWQSSAQDDDDSSGDEVVDKSAGDLSHVGTAAYDVLRKHHNHHHHELWNVTKGKVVGNLHCTPRDAFTRTTTDPPCSPQHHHDEWFPQAIGEIISRTEEWCDILSLTPPEGLFLDEIEKALIHVCQKEQVLKRRITIRMIYGNIPGMNCNCHKFIAQLAKKLPPNAHEKVKIWVGAWRKDVSWNHAKIIAVDGTYLWTGGHNFWDRHYLQQNPVLDLSLEMQGGVAVDAHYFANAQWGYIVKKQSTVWGRFVDQHIPDALDVPRRARVTVSEFPPATTSEFPPYYKKKRKCLSRPQAARDPEFVPVITMGRYGKLLKKARPSDDAFVAMMESAQHSIRMAVQDFGPVKLPGTNSALPGMRWPTEYINAIAKVVWERNVEVEIVLCNPGSIPGGLHPLDANYGNGWTCVDVAAEIIKAIQKLFPYAKDEELRTKVRDRLRICFVRSPKGGKCYKDGKTIGLHTKHFIIDDICCYIGSQNLYMCDLAEWGVVIDDAACVQAIKGEFWDPLWRVCYVPDDCDVQKVMDGLKIDRGAVHRNDMTKLQIQQEKDALRAATYQAPHESPFLESERLSLDNEVVEEEGTEIDLRDSSEESEGED